MRNVYNFSAGPSMLPEEVLRTAQAEMLDWHGTGMSIMELGHRGPEFKIVAEQAEADLRELMSIPNNYHVFFLPGGATAQFAMVPLNLLGSNKKADYIDTGIWSKKAIDEAKRYGTVNVAAKLFTDNGLIRIPQQNEWTLDPHADYLHFTPNETIEGVEFQWVPKTGSVPIVADMSSNILSKPIDVNQFGIIYAGAQKNVGQAGITIVIIRDDLLHDALPNTPTLYQYKIHAENKSFYNTPPTFSWYIAGLTLAWMKKQGGIQYFTELNRRKSEKLYHFIDNNNEFYINNIHPECRSRMNVPFNLVNSSLTETFLTEATHAGLTNLKGHRLSGGIRASIYNAMPEEGVDALITFMSNFAEKN
ncbi:MAG: 3-phosphoserine/phosphohydroxythreonine transaminase [Gammaproteobacteria bacterium]|nr:3-phosphoserine/phosphohydroxythreonine transaminase [Gammaproteobacteria bacterium]